MRLSLQQHRFGFVALVLQAIFIVIFAVFADYAADADARVWGNATGELKSSEVGDANSLGRVYPMFQDVHVMIFIGFGFLMTFMKWYGFSAIGLNLLLASLTIQWSLIMNGLFHLKDGKFHIDIYSILGADFACASVLISFGALIGRLSPLQSLVLALIEVPLFVANEYVGLNKFLAVDIGGSMFVHVFGAYFGISASKTLVSKRDQKNQNNHSKYYNDLFSMIGTIFLWLYWPSFNAALANGDDKQRAVINTYLSLTSCTIVSFAMSSLMNRGKFEMEHVQNATLAGGVAVGTVADMMIRPHGALIVGAVAGVVSVVGYSVVSPRLKRNHFLDTCGVNNLHGMPGILAAVFGVIYSALASFDDYGYSLYQVFPARSPAKSDSSSSSGSSFSFTVKDGPQTVGGGLGRTAAMQAMFQAAAFSMTLLCAVIGGLLTGFLLKLKILDRLQMEDFYTDTTYWHTPDDLDAKPIRELQEEDEDEQQQQQQQEKQQQQQQQLQLLQENSSA